MNLVRSLMITVSLHWMRASRKSDRPDASKCRPSTQERCVGDVCGMGGSGIRVGWVGVVYGWDGWERCTGGMGGRGVRVGWVGVVCGWDGWEWCVGGMGGSGVWVGWVGEVYG